MSDKDEDRDVILIEPTLEVIDVSSSSDSSFNDMEDLVPVNIGDSRQEKTLNDNFKQEYLPVKWRKIASPKCWTLRKKNYHNPYEGSGYTQGSSYSYMHPITYYPRSRGENSYIRHYHRKPRDEYYSAYDRGYYEQKPDSTGSGDSYREPNYETYVRSQGRPDYGHNYQDEYDYEYRKPIYGGEKGWKRQDEDGVRWYDRNRPRPYETSYGLGEGEGSRSSLSLNAGRLDTDYVRPITRLSYYERPSSPLENYGRLVQNYDRPPTDYGYEGFHSYNRTRYSDIHGGRGVKGGYSTIIRAGGYYKSGRFHNSLRDKEVTPSLDRRYF